MSTILTGSSGNITTKLSTSISALANNGSGAVRVTTSTPHLFGQTDRVYINTSVTVGFFDITVIDSTHFDLNGSTFVSTSVGTAIDYSLTPQIQAPTDGDPLSAQLSGLLSALQSLADRTQYLQKQANVTANPPPFFGSVNLYPQFQSTIGNEYGASAYDPVAQKWLVTSTASGTGFQTVVTSRDIDGTDWPGILGASGIGVVAGGTKMTGVVRSNDSSVQSKYVCVGLAHSGVASIWQADSASGSSWVNTHTFGGSGTAETVSLASTPGVIVAAIGATTAGSTGVGGLFASGDNGTSWGTANVTLQSDSWLLKPRTSALSNHRVLAIPSVAGSASGELFWWTFDYLALHSTTITAGSQSALLGSTETPTALTWATDVAGNAQWILATWTGTQTNIYAASDSATLTWYTVNDNLGMAGFLVFDMASIGAMILAAADEGPGRVACSPDGGITWQQCAAEVKTAAGTTTVSASPNQFLVQGPVSIMPSLTYGSAGGIGSP